MFSTSNAVASTSVSASQGPQRTCFKFSCARRIANEIAALQARKLWQESGPVVWTDAESASRERELYCTTLAIEALERDLARITKGAMGSAMNRPPLPPASKPARRVRPTRVNLSVMSGATDAFESANALRKM